MTDKYVEKQYDPDRVASRLQELAVFFQDTNTELICIDPDDLKSVEKGIKEISNRIEDAAKSRDGYNA